MDIPNELVLQMIGTFEAFSKNLINRYQAEQEKDQSPRITVYFDGYSEETDDLCARGNQGGETMPPRYSDGSFRVKNTKTGLMEYRFRHNGKNEFVYGYSKQDCYDKRSSLIAGTLIKQKKNDAKSQIITYKEWAIKWFEIFKKPKNYKKTYLDTVLAYLKNYIYPKIGKLPIAQISTMDLQNLLVQIKSDNTRTKVAAILSETFRRACAIGHIEKNVFLGVDFKRYENPNLGALTHMEQELILASIKEEDLLDLTKLLLFTGLRQGEALALTAQDIDFINLKIVVNKTLARDGFFTTPKTKAANRIVPIVAPLVEILKKHCGKDSDRLFNFSVNFTSHFYSAKFKELGLTFTGHILRHTFITNAYELSFPPYVVQRWVGHSKIQHADFYLALRNAKDFKETEVVKYMKLLKQEFVI